MGGSQRKAYKKVSAFLTQNGYAYESTNSKNFETWTRCDQEPVKVNVSIAEHVATQLIHNVQKKLGVVTSKDSRKRDAQQVKQRQADDRARAAEEVRRLDAERARLVAEREARLGVFTPHEFAAINALIEANHREMQKWRRLMEAAPSPLNNAAKHVAKG